MHATKHDELGREKSVKTAVAGAGERFRVLLRRLGRCGLAGALSVALLGTGWAYAADSSDDETVSYINGSTTITQGGVYDVADMSDVTITVNTKEPVVFQDGTLSYGSIDCVTPFANITIRDMRFIVADQRTVSPLRFAGEGNVLTVEGYNSLEQCYNQDGALAVIHVPEGADLTINGTGTLSLYKHSYGGAGIGGDAYEAAGSITVAGATIIAGGINGGYLAGSDYGKAGTFTVLGGTVLLKPGSNQAALGGFDEIVMAGGTMTLIGDALIYGADEESSIVRVSGGDLRISPNGDMHASFVNAQGEEVVAYTLDLSGVAEDVCEVLLDGELYYRGDLVGYDFSSVLGKADSLVMYMSRKDHALTVNDTQLQAVWDEDTESFVVTEVSTPDPDPVDPDPVDPDPVDPDPVTPDPDPVTPDPVDPDSVDPDSVDPDPVDPDPVDPDPATPEDSEPLSFADVDYSQWYGDGVAYVSAHRIMTGYDDGTNRFGVGCTLTRAEFATLLWRYAEPEAAAAFDGKAVNSTVMPDVEDNAFYTAAVNWAASEGVIYGYDNHDGTWSFGPNDPISFEQMMTIVTRFAQPSAAAGSVDQSVFDKFKDGADVSEWAAASMEWVVQAGLVSGYDLSDGLWLMPGENVMRERAAVIIYRAYEQGILS